MMINRFKIGIYSVFVLTFALFMSYSAANAQITFSTNEAQFIADNPGLLFQDFQATNAAPGAIVVCTTLPLNVNTNDNCFSPGDILPGIEFNVSFGIFDVVGENVFPAINTNPANMLITDSPDSNLDILFSGLATEVGLNIGCISVVGAVLSGCSQTVAVNVFTSGNILLGSTTVDVTDAFDSFVGVETTDSIARISLVPTPPTVSEFKGLANVRFGGSTNVPTLSEWGLIAMAGALGIVGFFVIRRRQVAA